MRGSVQKKKDEVALWEIVTVERKTQPKKRAGAQHDIRAVSSRQSKTAQSGGRSRSIQIIGQDGNGYAVPRRQAPRPQGSRQHHAARSAQELKRRKARKRRAYFYRTLAFSMVLCCFVMVIMLLGMAYQTVQQWKESDITPAANIPIFGEIRKSKIEAPEISTAFLELNDYSRPGTELNKIKSIFVHYTANPGTSAVQNRSYFANLAQTQERSASAHYIIGYEGEIVQCIPLNEQAYAVMTRNEDSISIECCYVDKDGKFTQETYDSLVHMLAWLLQEYKLKSSDILRHYDCGGKLCPLYYVEHEDAWEQLLADVEAYEGE